MAAPTELSGSSKLQRKSLCAKGSWFCAADAWRDLQEAWYWAFIGLILFCVSFPCLYWNEGRSVTRTKTLRVAKDQAVELGPMNKNFKAHPRNTGKLIHFTGTPYVTSDVQVDNEFHIESRGEHAKRVVRTAQMYQWITQTKTEHQKTGKKDNHGKEIMKQVQVVIEPKQGWGPVPAPQPQVPKKLPKGKTAKDFQNPNNWSTQGHQEFKVGAVMIGPFALTVGMVQNEMKEEHKSIKPVVQDIKDFIISEKTIDQFDKEHMHPDHDDLKETDSLLHSDPSHPAHGISGKGLSKEDRDYLIHAPMKVVAGNTLLVGPPKSSEQTLDLKHPKIGDYKVSWIKALLPQSNGNTLVHTVMAEQVNGPRDSGFQTLRSWMPEEVEQFHLDACCGYICPIGYQLVEEPPRGYGCITCLDDCFAANTSSERQQEDTPLIQGKDGRGGGTFTEMEEGRAASSNNSRKVERVVEGVVPIDEIISDMNDVNTKKTKWYRYIGFMLMMVGFQTMVDPFPKLFAFIPLVGTTIGSALSIVLFIVGLIISVICSISVISIAWIRYRPVIGCVGLLVAAALFITLMCLEGNANANAA